MASIVESLIGRELAPQRSVEWLKARGTMLTATDIAAICGLDPYSSKKQVILKKLFPEKFAFSGNVYTRHGQKFEEVVKLIEQQRTQESIVDVGLLRHPAIPFIGASPDGISTTSHRLKEIKCPPKRKIKHGEVPKHYWVQMQVQLQVTQLPVCDYIEAQIVEGDAPAESHPLRQGWTAEVLQEGDVKPLEYVYAPLDLAEEEAHQYMQKRFHVIQESRPLHRLSLKVMPYQVLDYHVQVVERDDTWWADNFPHMQQAWAFIERMRAMPNLTEETLREHLQQWMQTEEPTKKKRKYSRVSKAEPAKSEEWSD
jgi:putative phage-type endonuclease